MQTVETNQRTRAKRYPEESILRLNHLIYDVAGKPVINRKTRLDVTAEWLAGIERVRRVRDEEKQQCSSDRIPDLHTTRQIRIRFAANPAGARWRPHAYDR